MTKGILSAALIVLVLGSTAVFAQEFIETALYREVYAPAETVQVDILVRNAVRDIQASDISLTQGQLKIAVTPFLIKIEEGRFFLVFTLQPTMKNGTYNLTINDFPVLQNGILNQLTHNHPLIVRKEPPLISVFPGILYNKQGEVIITLTNKGQSTTVSIETPPFVAHVYNTPQLVAEGTSRPFRFTINAPAKEASNITFTYEKQYVIPLVFPPPPSFQQPAQEPPLSFITSTTEVKRTITPEKTLQGVLPIRSNLNKTLEQVDIAAVGGISPLLFISPAVLVLAPFEEKEVSLIINKDKSAAEGTYEGMLVASYQGSSISFPISITVARGVSKTSDVLFNETRQQPPQQQLPPFFNYSLQPSPQKKERSFALILAIAVVVVVVIFFAMLSRQTIKRQTFGQYVKKVGKK